MDQVFARLPVVVILIVSPVGVHCHTGFPVNPGKSGARNLLFRGTKVTDKASGPGQACHPASAYINPVVHNNIRLQSAHVIIQVFTIVVVPGSFPLAVKPEHAYVAIVIDKLLQLVFHVGHIAIIYCPGCGPVFPVSARQIVRMVPVHDRIVPAHL